MRLDGLNDYARRVPLALFCLLALLVLAACSGKQDFSRKETRLTPKAEVKTDAKQAAKTNTSLGQAYLAKGQLDLAMDKLLKALELDPKNADTHTVIAVAYEQIGKMTEAEKHYRQAHKLSPDSGLTANNFGRFLCSQGKYADSEKMFLLALDDPFYKTPETAMLNRAVCARKDGRIELATAQFREVLARKPEDTVALWSMAELTFAQKDYMRARAFYQRWQAGSQETPQSLEFGMMIEEQLGNGPQAAIYRKQLIERFPESDEAARQSKENSP